MNIVVQLYPLNAWKMAKKDKKKYEESWTLRYTTVFRHCVFPVVAYGQCEFTLCIILN